MCTTNIYSYVHPDGRKETTRYPALCPASRHGRPCANERVFQHPTQLLSSSLQPSASYFPPTPTYTPRSGTPNRSGDESDRSYRSASGASSSSAAAAARSKRSSGVYVNGQKVLDLNQRRSDKSRRERIVLVDGPRTPPQTYTKPFSAPSSPAASAPYIVDASPRRPVVVDQRPQPVERPRVQIEVVDSGHRSKHSRHTSTSSHDSLNSHSSSSAAVGGDSDDERRRRRRRQAREEQRLRQEQETRDEKLRARIAKANAEIAMRSAVPPAPRPLKRSTTSFTRPAAEAKPKPSSTSSSSFSARREAELTEALRRLELEQRIRTSRVEKQMERDEEAAQRQRLMERMQPRRRATISGGSGRMHRVRYDDGVYRWD